MEFLKFLFFIGSLGLGAYLIQLPAINAKMANFAAEKAHPKGLILFTKFNKLLWNGSSLSNKNQQNNPGSLTQGQK